MSRHPRTFVRLSGPLAALLLIAPALPGFAEGPEAGATTERVLVDPMSGFAIGGLDPVAYFIERRAVEGIRGIEATFEGAIWRFANKGNRDAFVDAPELYAPQFGGHCARAAALGAAADGDPRVFALHAGRLYFFRNTGDRALWLQAPEAHIAAAMRNWPRLVRTLAR